MDKMIRQFGELRKPAKDSRVIPFIFSTSGPDRHKTVLNQDNWDLKNFKTNGIVGYMHDVYGSWFGGSDPDDVIGKAKAWVEDGKLKGEIEFEPADINPKADKIFRKIAFGSLNAVSVGFMPIGDGHQGNEDDGEDPKLYYYHGQELLEISVVNIPSNPDALKERAFEPNIPDEFIEEVVKKIKEHNDETGNINEIEKFNLRIRKLKQSALTDGHY
jgi:HK97 family phage prohead protease